MSFVRNVLTLGGGSVAAQVVSLVAVPVITRLYDPGEFGAFSIIQAVVAVIFPIATLRLNAAALLPKASAEAAQLMAAAVMAVAFTASVLGVVILTAPVEWLFGNSMTSAVLWYLPVGVAVYGLLQCVQFWKLRAQRYGRMAAGQFSEALSDRAVGIGWGLLAEPVAGGLAAGRVVGGAFHLSVLLGQGWRELPRKLPRLSLGGIALVTRRYRAFPLFSTPAFLFSNGARELPTVVLGAMFASSAAGLYGLVVRMLNFPMLMIGDAIAKVFLQRVTSATAEKKPLHAVTGELIRTLFYLMLPPSMVIMAFGPDLFSLVFGQEWAQAGWMAQVLALSFFSSFVYRVLSAFFDASEKQSARLLTDLMLFGARLAGLIVGGATGGIGGAILGLLVGTLLVHVPAIAYLLKLAGIGGGEALRLVIRAVIGLLPAILGLFVIAYWKPALAPFVLAGVGVVMTQILVLRRSEPHLWARMTGRFRVVP